MNYQQTLDFLFQRLPMFSRIGSAAFKKDLTNTLALCDFLGNPQDRFKSIHIAGTNGKGSTSHMLAAIFQTAGYRTGLYTSPHLRDFRERIRINGILCDQDFVIDFTRRIQPMIEKLEPSFFEITVAMAFDYFAQQEVDIAVIEVGLGGRFDSTNIIRPELSIITNIGWDHMNLLGNTLAEIAFEKAGIIKPDIPVIIGEVIPETRPVFEKAAQYSPLVYAQQQRMVSDWQYKEHHLFTDVVETQTDRHQHYQLDLSGIYQHKNLLTVLEAAHQLEKTGWKTDHATLQSALKQVKKLTGFHGRWEMIRQNPTVILDVAHNVDGLRQVREQIELSDYHHLHIVFGMVKDKDVSSVLSLLPEQAHYYFTQAQIPRAMDAGDLQQKAFEKGLTGKVFPEVNQALQHALQNAHPNDLILVCGSVFLVGEVIH
ncbi:MAG: bifunctional folylpolyglutamate synthase/dihydrofolate synthase [Bacteroidota bacterium]|nr:bifunctional folylpolyglutamate synthase/dihydrofolate synthase [Bacteroidota bacterium]